MSSKPDYSISNFDFEFYPNCFEFELLSKEDVLEAAILVGYQFRKHDLTEIIENASVIESILYQEELMHHCLDNNNGTIMVTKYKCRNQNNNNKTKTNNKNDNNNKTNGSKVVNPKKGKKNSKNNNDKPIIAVTMTVDIRNYMELLSIEKQSSLSTMNDSVSVDIENYFLDLAFDMFEENSKKNNNNNNNSKNKNNNMPDNFLTFEQFQRQLNWNSNSSNNNNNNNDNSTSNTDIKQVNLANNKNDNLIRYGVTACIHPLLMRHGIMMYHNFMEYLNFVNNYKYQYFMSCLVNSLSFNLVQNIFGKENVSILAKIDNKKGLLF